MRVPVAVALVLVVGCGGRESGSGTGTTTVSARTTSTAASSGSSSTATTGTVDGTSSSSGCGSGELFCAKSCNPPVYVCQPAGFDCMACLPEQDAGDITDAAPAVTTDGAVCLPGEVACPLHWCTSDPTTACALRSECVPPPCAPLPETSDGAICSGPGESICSEGCSGLTYCVTGPCPEQPPCR